MNIEKTVAYKVGKAAERQNPFFIFSKVSPPECKLNLSDCFIRAIALAENETYESVELKLLNRLIKVGYRYCFTNETDYLNEKYPHQSFPAVKGVSRVTGKDFAKSNPSGRYVLRMAHHLTACIDGKIYDTWDCTDKTVYTAWKIER